MIDISKIKRQDIVNVRGIGEAIVVDTDGSGKNNPYKRAAVKIKTKDNKQVWIVPERIINRQEDKSNQSVDVVNGETSLWQNQFSNPQSTMREHKTMKLTEQKLKQLIREEAKRQINEDSKKFTEIDQDLNEIISFAKDLKNSNSYGVIKSKLNKLQTLITKIQSKL